MEESDAGVDYDVRGFCRQSTAGRLVGQLESAFGLYVVVGRASAAPGTRIRALTQHKGHGGHGGEFLEFSLVPVRACCRNVGHDFSRAGCGP